MLNLLFSEICDIVFSLEDGTRILCETTLNEDILKQAGFAGVDGFVDLMSRRLIPVELFDQSFCIGPRGTEQISELDRFLLDGGKISWKQLN